MRVATPHYTLTTADDRPYVYLDGPNGKRIADLFVLSGVHTLSGLDDTVSIEAWHATETGGEVVLTLGAGSSVWDRKIYRFRCTPSRLRYEVEVFGEGALAEATYFGGYCSARPRWGSGLFWSGQRFLKGFNPEPTTHEQYDFAPEGGATIDLCGVPLPGKDGWFLTPPPFCFAFDTGPGWLGFGLEAPAGENTFADYRYRGQQGAFQLALSFEGHTVARGHHRLPAVGLDFATGPYEAIERHCTALRELEPAAEARPKAAWWQEPILCGWGAQCYQAAQEGGRGPDYCRQELYEEFLETLERESLSPGIVVLDDKWQECYGENRVDRAKWPDLAGFVASQHAAGRRVLLWLKAWDPEGVPAEECITNAAGLPLALDPTNPACEERIRSSVRDMLSAQGYDADGFKIDFTARIPSGPGSKLHGSAWGLELLKRYLGIIYDEAKKVKPDALVMTHTPHPYLADVLDMIRLNDVNIKSDVCAAMTHRARLARIACPDALIDTDNWPMPDRDTWRAYVALQPELGVPSLYYTSHIDSSQEPLRKEDYQLLRETWRRHRGRVGLGRGDEVALQSSQNVSLREPPASL